MYGDRSRLVDGAKARLADPKREIRVLVVGRGIPLIEAAKLSTKICTYGSLGPRTKINISYIVEDLQFRVAVPTVIP